MLEETIFLPLNKYDSEPIINNEKIHPASHSENSITIPIETSFPKNNNTWLLVSTNNPFPNQYRGIEALLLCFNEAPVLRIFGFIGKKLPRKVLTLLQSWADLANLVSESPSVGRKMKTTIANSVKQTYKENKITYFKVMFVFMQLGLLYILYLTICWNISNIGYTNWAPPETSRGIVWLLRLDQQWNMFTPQPPHTSWWYSMEGELVNEKKVEIWKNGAMYSWEYNYDLSNDLPDLPTSMRNHRWFKYFENGFNQVEHLREPFGKYLCREYNKRNPVETQLWKYKIYAESHTVDLTGKKTRSIRHVIWDHKCFEEKPFVNTITNS